MQRFKGTNSKRGRDNEDYDSRPHKPVSVEVRCKRAQQQARILEVPKPLPGCRGGKVPTSESSEKNVKNVMSEKEEQDKAGTSLLE